MAYDDYNKNITKSGKYFDEDKGWGGKGVLGVGYVDPTSPRLSVSWNKDEELIQPYVAQGYKFPKHNMASLRVSEIVKLIELSKQHGRVLDDDTVKQIVGKTNFENKLAYYHLMLDQNADKIGFNSTGSKYNPETGVTEPNQQGLDSYDPRANYYDLIIDGNSPGANEYRSAMESSIDRQQAEVDKTIAAAELDAYRMLGNQQLQLERQIAEQRMRSLRSGTTSAQLAAMELQNMFAGQTAAAGIASQVMQQRIGNAQQFAQQRGAIEPGLYDMINQNKTTLANVEAQRFAAQKGLEGYSTSHQADMMARLQQTNPAAVDFYRKLIEQSN